MSDSDNDNDDNEYGWKEWHELTHAAPDLYKACELMANYMTETLGWEADPMVQKARAALAKARGEA